MKKFKIGITLGDINGIGPEVVIKALSNPDILKSCTPIIYASGKVLGYHKNIVDDSEFSFVTISNARSASENKINVINTFQETANINIGKVSVDAGKFAYICLDAAIDDLYHQNIDALVTGPINKNAMEMADFPEKGHTEYLAKKVGDEEALMFMISDELRVAVATGHVPLKEVTSMLSKDLVTEKIVAMDNCLKKDFALEKPLIAVLGLNPHAGDDGTIGDEENDYIKPAIIELKNKKVMVSGPYSADAFFGSDLYKKFDGILAMYHDQGLIPFKSIAFGNGVNFTGGLQVIRTSPDHGTAFDIAGQNIANPASFREAINSALDIIRNRKEYNSARSNVLQKSTPDHKKGRA